MKKSSTLAALAAAVVSMFALVGSAQAANWAAAGGQFSASAGTTTLSVAGKVTSCTSSTASGALNSLSGPPSTSAWTALATVTPTFSTCKNAGVNYNVACSSASLNADANGYNGGTPTGLASSAGLQTVGSLTGISCTIKPTATPTANCSTVTGSVPGTYTNPNPLSTGNGSLSIPTTGQSLTVASVGGCVASIGTGAATYTAPAYSVAKAGTATVAPDIGN
jgi:hypothetical protein